MMSQPQIVRAAVDPEQRAIADIQSWVDQPSVGPEGFPLPLVHSWNAQAFGGTFGIEMIRRGHHVMPTLLDPSSLASFAELMNSEAKKNDIKRLMAEHWVPLLEYSNKHKLPLVMPGHNWHEFVVKYEDRKSRGAGKEIAPASSALMLKDGKQTRYVDPFGPIERWQEAGRFWLGNEVMQKLQAIYPQPPMVLMLNNNEGRKLRLPRQLDSSVDRFVAEYGRGPHDSALRARALREGYNQRLEALFNAGKEAMPSPHWQNNIRFLAYNLLWDTGHIGYKRRPHFEDPQGEWAQTWPHFEPYDGALSEVYDNDWEPGKQDVRLYSMQTESMSYHSVQDRLYAKNPNFLFSLITWDGGGVGNTWRGKNQVGKAYRYVTKGQRWDFARYEGWVQFSMWMTRPRLLAEFRWSANDPKSRNAFSMGTWMALVRAADRVWNTPKLAEYWRFGTVVPNRIEDPWWKLTDKVPAWLRQVDRWFALPCDANPSRDEWNRRTQLNVWAMAIELGEAPQRRWLLYAHAPLAAVADAVVTVPGYGEVTLPSIARGGTFYELQEAQDTLKLVHQNGPAEMRLTPSDRYTDLGEEITISAAVTSPPSGAIEGYTWHLPHGEAIEQSSLSPIRYRLGKPGEHLITLVAQTEDAQQLKAQTVIWTGREPDETVQYDLALDQALDWRGPWKAASADLEQLISYRHLPNRGVLPNPVITGARFVDAGEGGRALELRGDPEQGVWLAARRATNGLRQGYENRTVTLSFMTPDVNTRQVLFAEGTEESGYNIYLDQGNVYVGAWAINAEGADWPGHWLSAPVKPGTWYRVSLVMQDAQPQVADDVLQLHLNGRVVARGPARRVPRSPGAPRFATASLGDAIKTRFHDSSRKEKRRTQSHRSAEPYAGFLDALLYQNRSARSANRRY